jgi:TolA-binding protein
LGRRRRSGGYGMKALLIVLLAFASAAAEAASLEETYLAARNRYIANFKKQEVAARAGDALSKQEKQALSDLEQQLRRIIGDIAIRGFSSQGKTNFDTLSTGDVGFGQLDGLAFSSQDGNKCFGERAGREGFFPTVTQQAQSLIDRLTTRWIVAVSVSELGDKSSANASSPARSACAFTALAI